MWILSQITAFRGSHMFAVYAHNAYVHVDHYISAMCHDNYARMIKWSGDQGKQEFSSTPSEPLSLPLKKGRLRQMITDDQLMKIRKMFAQKLTSCDMTTRRMVSTWSRRSIAAWKWKFLDHRTPLALPPPPPPAIERDLAETYEIKLIEEYTIRRAADIKIEFITF